ncbi:type II secretion system protein [bacterium]|nr:type II secretion system protein [bacterium]
MMITFFSQKRKYRSLLAFSLTELLIVIAIIGILSAVLISRHTYIKKNQQLMACKANILSMVDWFGAYKVSNGFYPEKDDKGHTIGSVSNPNSARCVSSDKGELGEEFKGFPITFCPLGKKQILSSENEDVWFSYTLRVRWDEYTIQCSMHGWGLTRYVHKKGEAHGDFIRDAYRVNGEGWADIVTNVPVD